MANVPNLSVVRDSGKPKKLGRYELEECLGVDGGRETYRARVKGLAGFDRIFALKCLRRPGAVVARTDPFLVAAKRMTSVIDQRVARVLDADVIDGAAVVVTEFVHGLDLDRFREWAQVAGELATGSDPAAQKWQRMVAYLGSETASALAALHAQTPTVVHGGLSPRNVIVTSRGGVKLLDAGFAMAAQKGGDAPSSRAPAYAAPAPPGADPTAASDVRALGAMLFELASGELPPPGVTSAAARRMLDAIWPPVADLVGNMLAEDPALRPRAAHVAETLAKQWADMTEAVMASEMAALVRNFSAFVADGPATAGATPVTPVAVPVDAPPPAAPSGPSAASGSFLALSDAQTRVSPKGGDYASAIFKAAEAARPSSGEHPAAPVVPVVRATLGPPIGRPTLRSFAAVKPPEIPVLKPSSVGPLPARQAPLPVLSAGPLAKGAAALPTLPVAPPVPPPPPIARPPAVRLASPVAPAITLAPEPGEPAALAAPLPVADPFAPLAPVEEETIEPEAMAETADWGAQALAALGTQAGVSVSLLPGPGDGGAEPFAEAPSSEPGLDAAFALAPHPAPPGENWMSQPLSQGAAAIPPLEATAFQAPARQELLEEELLDEEQTPLLIPTDGGADGAPPVFAEPDPPSLAPQEEPVVDVGGETRAPLEAMAFVAEDEAVPEPDVSTEAERPAEELAAADPPERRARTRSALRGSDESEVGDDELAPPRSRVKKIVAVLAAAAALGAGAAALTIMLGGKKAAPPPGLPKPRVQKIVSTSPAAKPAPASKPAQGAATAPATAVKATASEAGATKARPEPAVAAKPSVAATAKASPPTAEPSVGKAAAAGPGKPAEAAVVAEKPAVAPAAKVAAAVAPAANAKPTVVAAAPAPVAAKAAESVSAKATSAASDVGAVGPGGTIRVRMSSQPDGARVWVDGEERGQTPCVVPLKPGSARVVLVHAGYLTSQSTLDVRAGASIDEKLKPVEPPMTGEARFRAECQTQGKLPIVVDGKETGILCPFTKLRVDPGVHTIGLLIPATGKVHQKEVTLSPGVRSVVFGD